MIVLLLVAAIPSVVAMVGAAADGRPAVSALAAGLFALAAVALAARINWPQPRISTSSTGNTEALALARNTRLTALIYGWGAAAMLAVYTLSGLKWQHGWQYGSAMALVAAAIYGYAALLARADSPPRTRVALRRVLVLTVAHGVAVALGLAFIVAAGKLWAGKPDWAANHVFVAGGLAVISVCLISAVTQRRLSRQA